MKTYHSYVKKTSFRGFANDRSRTYPIEYRVHYFMYPAQTRNHQNTGVSPLHSPRVFPTQQYLKFYWMCTIVKYSRWCTNFESLKNIEFCIFYVSAKDFILHAMSRGGEDVPHRTRTYLRYAYDNPKRSRPARTTYGRSEIAPCQGALPETKPHQKKIPGWKCTKTPKVFWTF